MQYSVAKHIDIKRHYIHDHVESGNFLLDFVDSENQIKVILTKPLLEEKFYNLCERLDITALPS